MTTFHTRKGDLLQDPSHAIVNTVNCVGVMGKGLALQFKQAFPNYFIAYKEVCNIGILRPGFMYTYKHTIDNKHQYIISFPTKDHFKNPSKLQYIENGLLDLKRVIKKYNIQSIAIPPLGCGLGGLKWTDVEPLIHKHLADIPNLDVYIYPPT